MQNADGVETRKRCTQEKEQHLGSAELWLLTFPGESSPKFLVHCNGTGHYLIQCTGNSGCFSQGKASSHSTALYTQLFFLLFFFFLCAVFSCFHSTGCEAYSFTTDGYGIFNVRKNLGACRTHGGGSEGTSKSAQQLTGITRRLSGERAQVTNSDKRGTKSLGRSRGN